VPKDRQGRGAGLFRAVESLGPGFLSIRGVRLTGRSRSTPTCCAAVVWLCLFRWHSAGVVIKAGVGWYYFRLSCDIRSTTVHLSCSRAVEGAQIPGDLFF
jgi:hypothetical protein